MYVPASSLFIATSLVIALILNFLPLQGDLLIARPDFVALAIAYWNVNHPHKLGMSLAFGMGLMMDVGNAGIMGQHALAYCVIFYLTQIFGRRLRLFSLLKQAPQIGFFLFIMQTVFVLIALSSGSTLPGWSYFHATITGTLLWAPAAFVMTLLSKPKPDSSAL
ncbi:rod shape-determining protein MreD [Nitrosomonas sp.]|uniref:rod shape-determining protein MreD n=1 Tax=Nitrosomonas sp. TaxID=42353 RepID=UPI0025EF9A14|nr:rod shape-determining protein MreD [Nitrosomonas sp.]